MNKQEFLNSLSNVKIDINKVESVEKLYQVKLSNEIKMIISICAETLFIDDIRLLGFKEILDAEKDLDIAFIQKKIIPVFDCNDNDFIVYHIEDNCWSLFNIVDECIFKKVDTLGELF